jgi:hypothetical protein
MPGQNSNDVTIQPSTSRTFVQNVLPFASSLAFHAGLLALGFVLYQSVKVLAHRQAPPPPLEMPDVVQTITKSMDFPLMGDLTHPVRLNVQDVTENSVSAGLTSEQGVGDKRTSGSLTATSNDVLSDTIIGAGPGARPGSRVAGPGDGDAGPLAPFGKPQLGGGSHLFPPGRGPGAHSVAFLCDASGSMLNKFASLRGELNQAVIRLTPIQSFGITFFGEKQANTLNSQLVMATPENKLRATNFLEDVTPRGDTNPLPALELAFKQKPQLIFLLTDGDFPDNALVLTRIRQLNRDGHVKINTIAFVNEADVDTAFIALLKQIAKENGGTYKHVTQDELP